MFVHAALELALPAATAVERLRSALQIRRLDELSDEAYQAGLHTLTRVGPFGDAPVLSKTVRLQMLEPRAVDDVVRVPLRWVATGATGHLFPVLDADLDITAIDEQSCTVSIKATYTPPLGSIGAHIDQLLLHRAAQVTMRSLLRGVGSSLSNPSLVQAARASAPQFAKVTFFQSPVSIAIPEA